MTVKADVKTFEEYMADDNRVSPAERERITFEVALIGKMIEAREKRGLYQHQLAELLGVTQPQNNP